MDQAASDYVLAVRVLHTGSIIMTHAVGAAPGRTLARRDGCRQLSGTMGRWDTG
jgi:hypothetical protein